MKLKEKIMNIHIRDMSKVWLTRCKETQLGKRGQQLCRVLQRHGFLTQIAAILCYRLMLDAMYITTLSPLFSYDGFTTNLSLLPYLCSWAAVLIAAPFLVQLSGKKNPSSLLLTLINFLYFLPLTSCFGCSEMDVKFFSIALAYWALLLVWQFKIPILYLEKDCSAVVNRLVYVVTGVACLFVLFISGKYTGFRFTLDFLNVYDIRAEAAAYRMPRIFSYVLNVMPMILSTLLLLWLQRKHYVMVMGITVIYLFLFSFDARKSVFFFLFLVLASYALYRDWMWKGLPALLAGAAGVAVLENKIIGTFYLMNLGFRRMMYVPVVLSEYAYTFYRENPVNFFRGGIMGKFSFDNLYTNGTAGLLGEAIGRPGTAANNGLLGDMFTHFPPLLGLLLMPLILIICFRLLDMTANKTDIKVLLPFCVWFASAFTNSSWSTVLLSHGFLITCLLLYIFTRKDEELK